MAPLPSCAFDSIEATPLGKVLEDRIPVAYKGQGKCPNERAGMYFFLFYPCFRI
jgi:hypothetical protein